MYRFLGPLLRMLPAEWAHSLGLWGLKLPWRWGRVVNDPFTWNGLTFRNRIGIAAGFDKNAVALRGMERLGVGFVEIGTVLVAPWGGNPDRPRLLRLKAQQAIWNRLGFPSEGMEVVARRLEKFPREARRGMVVGCNIGPHPGHLKEVQRPEAFLELARGELTKLVERLHGSTDFFVVNLSSPNTPGLRGMLGDPRLGREVIGPVRGRLRELDAASERQVGTPLLLKLPPENAEKQPWTREALQAILQPLWDESACDGLVAVNTSTRLARELMGQELGGLSGGPLISVAEDFLRRVKPLLPAGKLLIGCGGVGALEDARRLVAAGAELVELYSGMIYRGPGLPRECARALVLSAEG